MNAIAKCHADDIAAALQSVDDALTAAARMAGWTAGRPVSLSAIRAAGYGDQIEVLALRDMVTVSGVLGAQRLALTEYGLQVAMGVEFCGCCGEDERVCTCEGLDSDSMAAWEADQEYARSRGAVAL